MATRPASPADDDTPDPAYCGACSGTGEAGPYGVCRWCYGHGQVVEDLEDLRLARDLDRAEAREWS